MRLKRFIRTNFTLIKIVVTLFLVCSVIVLLETYKAGYITEDASSLKERILWVGRRDNLTESSALTTREVERMKAKGKRDRHQGLKIHKKNQKGPCMHSSYLCKNVKLREKIVNATDIDDSYKKIYPRRLSKNSKANYQKHCKRQRIKQRVEISRTEIACKPHKAPEEACKLAHELYPIDPKLQTCKKNITEIYCELQEVHELKFTCSGKDKLRLCKIGVFSHDDGEIDVLYVDDITRLEKELENSAKIALGHNIKFLFLECVRTDEGESKSQLILLPFLHKSIFDQPVRQTPDINIVLLDSIARAHFFRSLPVVLEAFDDINTDPEANTEILDFELFQSVHGHSAENFHAFFTGKLFAKNLTENEKEKSSVGIETLYRFLRKAGYETLYQDDVCWKYWWGMRLELGAPRDWMGMKEAIKSACIDNTGLSLASCKILADNNLKTPFNGPEDSQICFNGRFQHAYYFEHLLEYFRAQENRRRRPRIGFTTINTAHDYKGLRVQTLNNDLADFVRKLARMENVLTILMADHGNTYTRYTSAILEGRFEMHHPSLFMILPPAVKSYLGDDALKALRMNTRRLLTMIDLHKTILAIATKNARGTFPKERGLLEVIPAERRCDDLELALPNLCVCEGWDTPAKNDTKQVGIVEFAVGTLNNMIDLQFMTEKTNEEKKSEQRKCHRLFVSSFSNVRERSSGSNLITTLDFMVKAGPGSGQQEDIFHVEVQSTTSPKLKSKRIKLLSYDRLSQYGIYRECKDPSVNVKLCICSLKDTKDSQHIWDSDGFRFDGLIKAMARYPKIPASLNIEQSTEEPCIFYLTRNFPDKNGKEKSVFSGVIEIINSCKNKNFKVLLDIKTWNCKPSNKIPSQLIVKQHTIMFVAVVMRDVSYWDCVYNFDPLAVKIT